MPYDVQVYHRQPNMLAPPELQKIHPLGKSPVIAITAPGSSEPVVLAESGFIFQYLTEHFTQNKNLAPTHWKEGQEGKLLGETDAWMRYQYFLQYSEGSLMPNLVQYIIMQGILYLFRRIGWWIRSLTFLFYRAQVITGTIPGQADFQCHSQQDHIPGYLPQY